MRLYSVGQLSNSEKSDILSKHSSVYNGYKAIHPKISNEQPLYVQDFANDKDGITVNGSGEVSSYTNKLYMKESEEEMSEISVDKLEKGKKYKFKSPSFEDDIEFEDEIDYPEGGSKHYSFKGDKTGHLMGDKSIESFVSHMDDTDEGIYDVEDINPKNKFDYTGESEMDEDHMELYEPMTSAFEEELDEIEGPLYSKVDPAYEFKSDGPMQAKGPYHQNENLDEQYFEDQFGKEPEEYEVEDIGYSRGGHDFDMDDFEDDELDRETAINKLRKGTADIEDIDFEEVDEDLKESFMNQKNKINEMFNRMNKYN